MMYDTGREEYVSAAVVIIVSSRNINNLLEKTKRE